MSDFLAGPITDPLPQRITPASTTLIDAANISIDASVADVFIVELTANRNLLAPTNPKGGQRFTLVVKQPVAGGKALTFDAAYTDVASVVLNTAASGVTVLQFVTVVSSAGAFTHACVSSSTQSTALGMIKSGTLDIADGANNGTAVVGAAFNGKPVVVTIGATTGAIGAAVPQFKAVVAAGTLTVTAIDKDGNAAAVTKKVTLNFVIDGR